MKTLITALLVVFAAFGADYRSGTALPSSCDKPGSMFYLRTAAAAYLCTHDGVYVPIGGSVTGLAAIDPSTGNIVTPGTIQVTGTGDGGIVLEGSTSGSVELAAAPAAGAAHKLLMPTGNGTAGQALLTDGATPAQLYWGGGGCTLAVGAFYEPYRPPMNASESAPSLAALNPGNHVGKVTSITPPCTMTVTKVAFWVKTGCASCAVAFGIYDDAGTLVGSSDVALGGGTPNMANAGAVAIPFSTPVTLTAGRRYDVVFTTDSDTFAAASLNIQTMALSALGSTYKTGTIAAAAAGNGSAMAFTATLGTYQAKIDAYAAPIWFAFGR